MDTRTSTRVVAALLLILSGCGEKAAATKSNRSPTAARSPLVETSPRESAPPRVPVTDTIQPTAASSRPVLTQKATVAPDDSIPAPTQQGPDDDQRATLSSGAGEKVVEFPLRHTSVRARVSGTIARVEVTQLYVNPSADRLEAIYKFPLPANAAVTDMYFRIGNRVVYSEVHEKKQAQQIYEEAREQGRTAALTEQERPNLFTQSVANIPPGETVAVVLRYVHEIPFDDGRYSFVFPTTVGPRYIPGEPIAQGEGGGFSPDTDRVPDASRITPPMIPPGFRSAHDIDIQVSLEPGDAFGPPAAKSHRIVSGFDGNGARWVALAEDDRIPNKDFVLAWRPATNEPAVRALVERQLGDAYLMLFLQPPAETSPDQIRPRELVFLVDKSCSMSGAPLDAARGLIEKSLTKMGPEDTFQITAFDGAAVSMSPEPLPNTPENVQAGVAWLSQLYGSGGTEMLTGIRAALTAPKDPKRLRLVVFATDGFIGNETEILQAIDDLRGSTRVFGFGIGSSVNRYLIEGMGRVGRGASDVVLLNEDATGAVNRLFKRLDRPVLTDLTVGFDGLRVQDVLPERMPDLFAGQPLVILGKLESGTQGTITLSGKLGETPWTKRLAVQVQSQPIDRDGPVLGTVWARRRVDDLTFRQPGGPGVVEQQEITQLGLRFKLITQYTSLVAVERELKVDPNVPLTQVLVPNEMPEGVSFDAIFGDAKSTEAEISPGRVKPGDPEIRVHAGEGATGVRIQLPFDEAPQEAIFDPASGDFVLRFLVPPSWPDGRFDATVEIAFADGRTVSRIAPIKVDTTPAAIGVLSAPRDAAPGETIRLVMKPVIAVGEVMDAMAAADTGEALKARMEVKEVLVRAPWGEIAEAKMDGAFGAWTAELTVPADAQVSRGELEIVASDTAGNISRRFLPFAVSSRASADLGPAAWLAALLGPLLGAMWLFSGFRKPSLLQKPVPAPRATNRGPRSVDSAKEWP